MTEIILNSTKHKISNKSYQIAIQKLEKNIELAFEEVLKQSIFVDKESTISHENSNQTINFFQVGSVLYYLKIFREAFEFFDSSIPNRMKTENIKPIKNEKKKLEKNFQNYKDIQL